MEYTRDLALNLRSDIRRERRINKSWTSLFWKKVVEKVKGHKYIVVTITSAVLLITLDAMLLLNFISILGRL